MTDRLDDLLAGMASDLAAIHKALGWAEGYGYGKPGRGLDAEHGTDLARSEAERLAGPTYDLGIGDHGARLALQRALPRLARVEVLLICANAAAGWTRIASSYGMVALGEVPTSSHIALSIRVIDVLLDSLVEHLPGDAVGRRRVERWAFKASQHLTWCLGGFSRALDRGEVSKPSTPMCKNGPHAPASPKQAENRCEACAQWFRRNGFERPVHRMTEPEDREPLKMKNKRAGAGFGRGDETLLFAFRREGH